MLEFKRLRDGRIVNIGSCNISISDREFNEYFKEFKEN